MRAVSLSILTAVSLLTVEARAGSPADKKLAAAATPVLGDHFTVSLPDGMASAPRRASIMAAENAPEDETRAMLDDGPARFVMMAYELYALAGADPKVTVEADFKRAGHVATFASLALPKPLVGFQFTPTKFTSDKEANLVYGTYVVSGDGTIQVLAFYVNAVGAAHAADWSALAKKVIGSLAPGKRVIGGAAGDRPAGDLVLTVPAGWVTSPQPGPDFLVTHIRKLAVLGQESPSCGVYVGHHPTPQYKAGLLKTAIKPFAGTLLGTKVDWDIWTTRGRWSTEALAAHPNGKDRVHAFCSAATETELADVRKIAATLRKKK
jgi:hypothetical protein